MYVVGGNIISLVSRFLSCVISRYYRRKYIQANLAFVQSESGEGVVAVTKPATWVWGGLSWCNSEAEMRVGYSGNEPGFMILYSGVRSIILQSTCKSLIIHALARVFFEAGFQAIIAAAHGHHPTESLALSGFVPYLLTCVAVAVSLHFLIATRRMVEDGDHHSTVAPG